MAIFLKILKYDVYPEGIDKYEHVSDILSQKIDPPSLEPESLDIQSEIVLHSPMKRAVMCIKKKTGTEYLAMPELREIPFNIKELCSKDEWNKYGSAAIRKIFKKTFIGDKLLISRKKIFDEINTVLKKIVEFGDGKVTVVSHSFRLKLIQAYLLTNGEIVNKPSLINDFIDDNKKTFEFGQGFEFDCSKFQFS